MHRPWAAEARPSCRAGSYFHKDTHPGNFFSHRAGAYNAIFSYAVLEHVGEPLGLLDQTEGALEGGGVQVHMVDLADHHIFGDAVHPLTFLTIPHAIYSRMIANSGRPNRSCAIATGPGRPSRGARRIFWSAG